MTVHLNIDFPFTETDPEWAIIYIVIDWSAVCLFTPLDDFASKTVDWYSPNSVWSLNLFDGFPSAVFKVVTVTEKRKNKNKKF